MKSRRAFLHGSLAAGAAFLLGPRARGRAEPAPDYLPILHSQMARGDYVPHYEERELTEPVLLCDAHGRLNPAAVGWSRVPLVRANLRGHWPRKKKWNFWNWLSPGFVFSITLADIDLVQFCSVSLIDFQTRESLSGISVRRSGSFPMPEEVERSIRFESRTLRYELVNESGDIQVSFHAAAVQGKPLSAEFIIRKPAGHETLNIVVPWTRERFQLNSKHNTLPVDGWVKVGERIYELKPEECHGVQDFGRGMWPYRSYWNWGVATGRQGDNLIGVNFGGKWTTGTGVNENGICFNGRLYKIMEDLVWEYDPANWMKPWRVHAPYSGMMDLTLTPAYPSTTKLSLGFLATGGTCVFGRWNGILRFAGREVEVKHLPGWAEEFSHRW